MHYCHLLVYFRKCANIVQSENKRQKDGSTLAYKHELKIRNTFRYFWRFFVILQHTLHFKRFGSYFLFDIWTTTSWCSSSKDNSNRILSEFLICVTFCKGYVNFAARCHCTVFPLVGSDRTSSSREMDSAFVSRLKSAFKHKPSILTWVDDFTRRTISSPFKTRTAK